MLSNIFAVELVRARKLHRLTQDEVCVMLGVSESSVLSRWENGRDIPSMKIVEKLINLYGDPLIGYLYLQQCTTIGSLVLPQVERKDLGNAVLLLQKEHTDIHRIKDVIIDIACDGHIDDDEQDAWRKSLEEIGELASACMGLKLMQQKMPSQGCNLERAFV